MKKILGLLAVTALVATTSATVVACGEKPADKEDIILNSEKLQNELKIQSSEIKADGTITLELQDKSILTAEVKKDSLKDGEVTIVVSTTEDKLTDKEVKESVKVMFTPKDGKEEDKKLIKTVSVKVEAKKVVKVKLDGVKLDGFTATNATTDQEVIDALKAVKGLENIAAADVKITKVEATESAKGSITIEATKDSKLVEGKLVLEIAQLQASKINLDTVTLSLTATNATTDQEVLDALKGVEGLDKISASDVKITKVEATQDEAGSITIEAESASQLVEGKLVLSIAQLTI
ncbi:lipoprotein [Spiroplasma sp. BIUS-1]|uniref:lipoprotein n=1 Tax=Spiroplasma sp. BIUS-1 TaxID=216964 RepID=UPI0013972749|nr:lipoprotein [Spiroplasma sp. BIUS-1]QHX36772.1 hypothetical protein SBIUS_v1c05190 [Spiroplasma sp. BIUS-1]